MQRQAQAKPLAFQWSLTRRKPHGVMHDSACSAQSMRTRAVAERNSAYIAKHTRCSLILITAPHHPRTSDNGRARKSVIVPMHYGPPLLSV